MSGQAFIKFYGSDWRSDPRLRLCSLAARGVWTDAISLMMEAEPYGHLAIDGRAMTAEEFAVLICAPVKLVRACLAELESRGVSSRNEDGLTYSRRMLRDKAKLDAARESGKRGGNPTLKGPDNPDPPPKDNGPDKLARESQKPEARSQKEDADASARVLAEIGGGVGAVIVGTNRVGSWLREGFSLDLDILPAIRRCCDSKRRTEPDWIPNQLKYFDKAIADERASRLAPMPKGYANGAGTHDRPPPRQSATEAALAGLALARSGARGDG